MAAAARVGSTSHPYGAAGRPSPRPATSCPSCRRSATSKLPNVRRSSGSTSVNVSSRSAASQSSIRPRSWPSCRSTTPLAARNPSTNAAPAAGSVPTDSARDSRRPTASASHEPRSCSNRVARPATSPCVIDPSATRAMTRGHPRRRASWSTSANAACVALSRSAVAAADSSSSDAHAGTTPATTRATSPSTTERRAEASVARTSP